MVARLEEEGKLNPMPAQKVSKWKVEVCGPFRNKDHSINYERLDEVIDVLMGGSGGTLGYEGRDPFVTAILGPHFDDSQRANTPEGDRLTEVARDFVRFFNMVDILKTESMNTGVVLGARDKTGTFSLQID
ncbi:hypothetical protein OAA05_01135 [bacterium]|nr:hypothetical protein [bacterium]